MRFTSSAAALRAALAELDAAGAEGGGAVDAPVRERALAAYLAAAAEPPAGLVWSSTRTRAPRGDRVRAARADDADQPASATENAGGIVHVGSTYLAPGAPAGDARVVLRALADARRTWPQRVDAVHLQLAERHADPFAALATAFQNCGAYVEVADGVELAAPLQLVWMAQPGTPAAVFPHTVVRLGAGARAIVVERHTGAGETFVAGIVEAELGPGARLDYVVVQAADESARVYVQRRARCAAAARIGWHVADLGGARVRSASGADLAGTGAAAETNAFFFARGFAQVECRTDAAHVVAHTGSQATIRGAVTDRGRGDVAGALHFGPDVAHCVATMRTDGLILSRHAALASAPVLVVATHHVAASQSTSIGSLDEEELFYVQSRGITRALAERMMALAFFEPVIARFPSDALRDEVRTALDAALDDVPDTFA